MKKQSRRDFLQIFFHSTLLGIGASVFSTLAFGRKRTHMEGGANALERSMSPLPGGGEPLRASAGGGPALPDDPGGPGGPLRRRGPVPGDPAVPHASLPDAARPRGARREDDRPRSPRRARGEHRGGAVHPEAWSARDAPRARARGRPAHGGVAGEDRAHLGVPDGPPRARAGPGELRPRGTGLSDP